MNIKQIKNLLPRKQLDRVALKTAVSKIKLSRLISYRKLSILKPGKLTKLAAILTMLAYLAGYYPVLSFPPIQRSEAKAQFDQTQTINAGSLGEPYLLPHPGYLTTKFSNWHPGIDIATGIGMPVHPVASGTIKEVVYGFLGFGHYVVVEHKEGLSSTYAHMGKIYVKAGDTVTSGSTLGLVGVTGRTSGPHTHLEIYKDKVAIDPLLILPSVPELKVWIASKSIAN